MSICEGLCRGAFSRGNRAGGEALPDTHWTIQTQTGELVKESVGALPSHVLAPGDYQVVAKSGGRLFKKSFSIKDGEMHGLSINQVPLTAGDRQRRPRDSCEKTVRDHNETASGEDLGRDIRKQPGREGAEGLSSRGSLQ